MSSAFGTWAGTIAVALATELDFLFVYTYHPAQEKCVSSAVGTRGKVSGCVKRKIRHPVVVF